MADSKNLVEHLGSKPQLMVAFIAGVCSVLIVQAWFSNMAYDHSTASLIHDPLPPGAECMKHSDCSTDGTPGYEFVCNGQRKCERLENPNCTCAGRSVRCLSQDGRRARHTYCETSCQQYVHPNGVRGAQCAPAPTS